MKIRKVAQTTDDSANRIDRTSLQELMCLKAPSHTSCISSTVPIMVSQASEQQARLTPNNTAEAPVYIP